MIPNFRKAGPVFALLAVLSAAVPAGAQDATSTIAPDLGARVAEDYVRPSIAGFAQGARDLSASIGALCKSPGQRGLDAARADFASAVEGWGRLSILRFGPLVAENRFERLFFWPDPRGVTLRQVQGLISEEDASALGALDEKSVALQGLPALEFVLFGNGAETLASPEAGYRCRYGVAIAEHLVSIAEALATDWAQGTAFAESFTAPAPDRDPYRSASEVAGEIVKALGTGLQFISNAEIKPALGEAVADANGNRAPLRRSDLTFELFAAQLHGLRDLLAATGWQTSSMESRPIADNFAFDLDRAIETVVSVDRPAETAFENGEDWEKLRYVTVVLDYAGRTVSEQLAGALGLTMGFNALDGD